MANETQEKKEEKKVKQATAKKRELQDQRKRVQNRAYRSQVRSTIKQFKESLTSGNEEQQKKALATAYSLVDKGVNKSIFKRNKASRIKARLTARMHAKA